jgi:hypothetical protein
MRAMSKLVTRMEIDDAEHVTREEVSKVLMLRPTLLNASVLDVVRVANQLTFQGNQKKKLMRSS